MLDSAFGMQSKQTPHTHSSTSTAFLLCSSCVALLLFAIKDTDRFRVCLQLSFSQTQTSDAPQRGSEPPGEKSKKDQSKNLSLEHQGAIFTEKSLSVKSEELQGALRSITEISNTDQKAPNFDLVFTRIQR